MQRKISKIFKTLKDFEKIFLEKIKMFFLPIWSQVWKKFGIFWKSTSKCSHNIPISHENDGKMIGKSWKNITKSWKNMKNLKNKFCNFIFYFLSITCIRVVAHPIASSYVIGRRHWRRIIWFLVVSYFFLGGSSYSRQTHAEKTNCVFRNVIRIFW